MPDTNKDSATNETPKKIYSPNKIPAVAAVCWLSEPNRHKFMPAYLVDSTSHGPSPSLNPALPFLKNSPLPICRLTTKDIVTALDRKRELLKVISIITPRFNTFPICDNFTASA